MELGFAETRHEYYTADAEIYRRSLQPCRYQKSGVNGSTGTGKTYTAMAYAAKTRRMYFAKDSLHRRPATTAKKLCTLQFILVHSLLAPQFNTKSRCGRDSQSEVYNILAYIQVTSKSNCKRLYCVLSNGPMVFFVVCVCCCLHIIHGNQLIVVLHARDKIIDYESKNSSCE